MVTSTKMMSPASGRSLSSTICLIFSEYSTAVPGVRFVGDQADAATCAVAQEPFRGLVEDHLGGAQLEGAQESRQDRQHDDDGDEEPADLHAVRTFANVVQAWCRRRPP